MANTLQKKQIKKKKHPLKMFFSLAMIFISAMLIYIASSDLIIAIQLKNEISSSVELINDLETRKMDLTVQKKKLENPEYVKLYARGKFLVSKPNERIFKFLPKNDDTSTTEK